MPCWFYDKKELLNTPSARDGISADVEAWYRKEGAKHIIDAGNKLGLYVFYCLIRFSMTYEYRRDSGLKHFTDFIYIFGLMSVTV